ncbi:hypothetical protein GCM10029992_15300 [Glycomyces albus]
MTQDIGDFVSISCELVGLGEPTHREPAFARVRNELFAQLVDRGFQSVALETGRAAALAVNDFVQGGSGSLDSVMREGFSHAMFGESEGNRDLVAWMREHNEGRSPRERLAFHGMDAPMEFSAPSPGPYLEYARDFLGLDLDIADLIGDEERWSRAEAVMDPAASPGDSAEAERLRAVADDMLVSSTPARPNSSRPRRSTPGTGRGSTSPPVSDCCATTGRPPNASRTASGGRACRRSGTR